MKELEEIICFNGYLACNFMTDDEDMYITHLHDSSTILNFFKESNDNTKIIIIKYIISLDNIDLLVTLLDEWSGLELTFDDNIFFKIAVSNGSKNVVKYLIDSGIDVTASNNFAIRVSPMLENSDMLQLIIDLGANIHIDDDYPICSAAYQLAYNNDSDTVKLLIKYGANIHARNDYLFWRTIVCGNTDDITSLLEIGANIHALELHNLKFIIKYCSYDTIKVLLNYGVDLSVVNDYSPSLEQLNRIQLCIDNGVDVIKLACIIAN